ncbi:hypothetical protein [Cohnella sp. AR92]|uniref:hypothetical protein n=1 Tax=Cohnella sp. AR92 TaxID=648716 RepID=UPI000F8C4E9B|nr:hypothetical protein [Cohnella sp. AR92]RUS48048.1 hypothetical protein ELR57_05810 [Cohnella sp. AR92]
MNRRFGPLGIVLIALIAIGIFNRIIHGASSLIIPVVLVAIVYLLYKFPPTSWRRRGSASSDRAKYRQAAVKSQRRTLAKEREDKNAKRRNAAFRVIEGNKNRDEEPPRYH